MPETTMPHRSTEGPSFAPHLPGLFHRALEEILGHDEVASISEAAGPRAPVFADSGSRKPPVQAPRASLPRSAIAATLVSLESEYGLQGGRGLALRVGQSCFRYGLREYGADAGAHQMAFRLLPLGTRIRAALRSLLRLLSGRGGLRVQLREQDGKFFLDLEDCPLCAARRSQVPVCFLAVGFLQEALHWTSGGSIFHVEEVDCQSQSGAF